MPLEAGGPVTGSGAEITVVWLLVGVYVALAAVAVVIELRRVKR